VDGEVNGANEATRGTERVSAYGLLFPDTGEGSQVVKSNVPRVKSDSVGEHPNA
jgi:hypothetical protein